MRYAIANFIENSGLTENGIQGTELYFRKEWEEEKLALAPKLDVSPSARL
jgi:hypothetical protein